MFFYKENEVVPPPSFDFTVSNIDQLSAAIISAAAGDSIFVSAGTYNLTSSLTINKSLRLFGAGTGSSGTIFQTAGTSGDPDIMFSISNDNVVLKDMWFKHLKTTLNTAGSDSIISVTAGGFPTYTYPKNFIMDGCKLEYLKFGIAIRGEGFKIANNRFVYNSKQASGATTNQNRCVVLYGQKGNCFIADNIFDNSVIAATAFRPIYSTSTNGSSNELTTGALIVSGNSNVGTAVHQFYNQDNVRGTTGGYDLYFLNNTINETNVFIVFATSTVNAGDIIGKVVLNGNTASGNHGSNLTKGMLAVDSSVAFRTSNLPAYVGSNTQTVQSFRADYVGMTQNPPNTVPAYLLGRKTTTTVAADVSTSIPTAPTMPETPTA